MMKSFITATAAVVMLGACSSNDSNPDWLAAEDDTPAVRAGPVEQFLLSNAEVFFKIAEDAQQFETVMSVGAYEQSVALSDQIATNFRWFKTRTPDPVTFDDRLINDMFDVCEDAWGYVHDMIVTLDASLLNSAASRIDACTAAMIAATDVIDGR